MVSIYDWFGYDIPIKRRYEFIKKAGFDGVLLWWSIGFGREEYLNAPELVRNAGLIIENIHTPVQTQNDLWLDNLEGEALYQCYLQCISDCSTFEIPTMVVHLPDNDHPYNELGLIRMKKIAEKAEQLGINVALENLYNLTNLCYMLEQLDSSRIGFCYDACHHINYFPEVDLLSMYGSRMMAMHLHDNGGERKQHQLPFDGNINWSEIMSKIAATKYAGATALEPMNWDYLHLSAEEFLNLAHEKVKKLEALRFQK